MDENTIIVGDTVTLIHEDDCIIPAGDHMVSRVDDGGKLLFLGGNIGVWRRRVVAINGRFVSWSD